ncbi:MAG: hypothetical protein QOE70_5584 [Chthoniobacter sp.]|nr:hypothetical protein [Chthoniobacter sp.]
MSAFKELEGLSFERGTAIKIEFPVSPEKSVTREPIYCYSSFLHRWLERGAVIDVYENGKRLNAHWVSWRDLYDVKGNYVKSMDDVTWVADGKRLGKGGALLSRINQWRKEPDVLIQVLTPFRWDPSDIHLGIAYPQLLDPRKFRVFVITPEAKDLFGSGAK